MQSRMVVSCPPILPCRFANTLTTSSQTTRCVCSLVSTLTPPLGKADWNCLKTFPVPVDQCHKM
eukprot:726414-Hanusia_phi.AAC.1